jgi:hypothetical protein
VNQKSWLLGLTLMSVLGSTAYAQDVSYSGDLRFGFNHFDRDERNGAEISDGRFLLRARAGAQWNISEIYTAKARLAGTVTDERNNIDFRFHQAIPQGASSIPAGDVTFDELFVRARYGQWEHRVGRYQHGNLLTGVAAKSFSRTNSNSWNVTWVDGIHSRYRNSHGWDYNVSIERNSGEGSTFVRRAPLGYASSDSRASYYASVDKSDANGLFLQRSADVTIIPAALYYNGLNNPAKRDYIAFTGRMALQWAVYQQTRFVAGAELAYAPNTPRLAAMNLPGQGDAKGTAYQVSLNLMDILPGHSVGVVYGENEAGWLLSTDFGTNQKLAEIRYIWRPMSGHLLQARVREREDLMQPLNAVRKRSEVDFFVRYTISL